MKGVNTHKKAGPYVSSNNFGNFRDKEYEMVCVLEVPKAEKGVPTGIRPPKN